MNLLFQVLYAQKCSSTHHKLAMDALRYLKCDTSDAWARLFLSEIQLYTDGAKAPDRKFRDFRNHVLHVADNFRGGAVSAAELWYSRLVQQLQAGDWSRAVYCAGVLSHYVTDPLMPLHTAQTEDEAQVHRFVEWGTTKIYGDLIVTHDAARALQNWKPPQNCDSDDWLALVIIEAAQFSHGYYNVMIDHYNPRAGRSDAAAGFDATCRSSLAQLLGRSIRTLAFVLDRAIAEANVVPPTRSLTLSTVLSGLATPLFWITRKLADRDDRKVVQAIWDELQATGKVVNALPDDDRMVREAHAAEVLNISIEELNRQPIRKAGSRHGKTKADGTDESGKDHALSAASMESDDVAGFYLHLHSPVVDAPSIGPKTAARLKQINIGRIDQLLQADVNSAVTRLGQRWITDQVFRDWQHQASLVCRIPGLRGHDAQLLVGVGITEPEQFSAADPAALLEQIGEFCATADGDRILRGSSPPDADEVDRWIRFAQQARMLRAA